MKTHFQLLCYLFFSYIVFGQCNPLSELSEDFESHTAGSLAGLPACWKKNAPALATIGLRNASGESYSGANYVNVYSFFSANATIYIVAPELSTIDGTYYADVQVLTKDADVTFEYGTMSNPDDAATFISAGTEPLTVNAYKNIITGNIPPQSGHRYFALKFQMPSMHSTVKIDDFKWIRRVEPCASVMNILVSELHHSSAKISWDAGNATGYSVEYGPKGFTQGSGTIVSVSGTTINLNNLEQDQEYDVYIIASCTNAVSEPVKYQFKTLKNSLNADHLNPAELRVFPNPVRDGRLYIDTEQEGVLLIYSNSGQVVHEHALSPVVDVSKLKSGLYWIVIQQERTGKPLRLIIE